MKGQKKQKDHLFIADHIDEQIDHINKSIISHSLQNDDSIQPAQQPAQYISSFMATDQRLVDGLESLYIEEANREIGERAWQRLQQKVNAHVALYKSAPGTLSTEQPSHKSQLTRKGITMLNDTLVKPEIDRSRPMPISRWKRYASLLTAAIVALCIVGSLFWVLNAAHRNTQTGAVHTNTLPAHSTKHQVESPKGVYIGGVHGVYRLDVKTGAMLWNYTPPNNPNAPSPYQHNFTSKPIVDGKYVYVTADTGVLYVLDAETGRPIWTHDFGQHFLVITAIQDDSATLYIRVGSYDNATDDYLYALSNLDGSVKTRLHLDVDGGVTIIQDKLYIILTNDLYVRDLATGKLIWHASIDAKQTFAYTTPQVVNGVAYITSSSVKLQDGQLIKDYTSYIYALNSQTGKLLWRSDPQSGVIQGAPVIYNGVAYDSTTMNNLIYAVHTDTGKEWWHQQESAEIASSIQEENGVIYAQVNQNGDSSTGIYSTLLGFKPDGTIVLQKKLVDFFGTEGVPSFVVQNGVVYTGGMNQVDAYRVTDGSLLWKGLTNLNVITFAYLTVVS